MERELLPLFLDVKDAAVTVAGGGPDAMAGARRLVAAGARVRIVATDLSAAREQEPAWDLVEAEPSPEHVDGCLLLVVATDDPAVDAALLQAASERGVIAVSLGGAEARAWLGRAREQGGVALAATTRGRSPELEERLAEKAGRDLTPELDTLAGILGDLRAKLEERFPDEERRALIWQQVLDSPVLALLQAGDEDEAVELAERMAWGTG